MLVVWVPTVIIHILKKFCTALITIIASRLDIWFVFLLNILWGHTDTVFFLFPWYSNWYFCYLDLCLTETTELLDGELDALRSFCTIKISKMRQQLHSKQADGGKSRKLQPGFTAKKQETSDLNCIVPDQLMNRIRLKNIRETVKQVLQGRKKCRFCLCFLENH